jgi:hypothetical protein
MIRLPISDNKERFETAVKDVDQLVDKGKTLEEITADLTNKYQEKDIRQLFDWIRKIEYKPNKTGIKNSLEFTVLALLLIKLGSIIFLIGNTNINIFIEVATILIYPVGNIIALILLYKEPPFTYLAICAWFAFSLSNMGDMFESSYPLLIIDIVSLIGIIWGIIASFILIRRYPIGMLKVKKIRGKYNINRI